ncbi:MAG TPA: serpin family protein [Streptosporangiaceae bacterium]|nr:serpin family protein [Streptosporangiaceae bacterium]
MRNVPAAADAALGADLYQILTEDAADTVFSPASVASALRIALCGARGQTAAELARVLHLDEDPKPQDAAAAGLRLTLTSGAGSGSATFRAPNTVWIQSGLPLHAAFKARLHDAVTLAAADFRAAPEATRTEINQVIATQTEGKISGLLPSGTITALTRLVLASAVYLKAAWTDPFPERATADAPFYPDGRDQPALTVPMMHGTASRAYLRGDGYQAVLLPYRDINLAMAVVLPDGPLAALRPKLAAAGLGGLLAGASRHRVTLSLPRFRLEAAFNLIPALRRLGIVAAFGGDADFGEITEAAPLRIGAVAHKAYVDVDEQGTEAAAATAVVIRAAAAIRPPPAVTMVVDRPFLFAIVDSTTGLPLFLGQVSHPVAG